MMDSLRPNFRRYLRPLVLLLALSLGLIATSFASTHLAAASSGVKANNFITGRIVDEKGAGIHDVNVILKGTTNGFQTSIEVQHAGEENASHIHILHFGQAVGAIASSLALRGTGVRRALKPQRQQGHRR
jgi:hypothetical protein